MQLLNAALFLALGSPAAAVGIKDPLLLKPAAEKSWTPARETSAAEVDARADQQWSPRPTDGPELLGRMELLPRLDGYTLSPGTCGYISSDGQPYGCINSKATCTQSNQYMGCCDSADCQRIQTTCISSAAAASGACDLPNDFHTLCCTAASLGQCFTWVFTTQTGGADSTYAFLDCASTRGTGLLLDYDPAWSRTHSTGSDSSTSTKSAVTVTATSSNTDDNKGGSSTNVGAIAGGVVGGVAAIALAVTAAILLIRRKKKSKDSQGSSPPAPDMSQMNQPINPTSPPPPTQTPSSPSNTAAYPSGVPSFAGGFTPSPGPQDPNNPYQQQPQPYPIYPNHTGQSQYPTQYPSQYPPQFPPQQQPRPVSEAYPAGAYGYPSPTSQDSPSPGAQTPGAVPNVVPSAPTHQQPPSQNQFASELPTVNPVGMESNRAELQ